MSKKFITASCRRLPWTVLVASILLSLPGAFAGGPQGSATSPATVGGFRAALGGGSVVTPHRTEKVDLMARVEAPEPVSP